MRSEASILEVQSLRKVFTVSSGHGKRQELVAVADVSFEVERGAALAIVGESGSGKTTIARMIMGLERATAGHITVCGEDRSAPAKRATDRRRRARQVQMVFQDPYSSLDRSQSVRDCLDEVLRVHLARPRDERAYRVRELLEQVGLSERHHEALPKDLSGGQRQRVAIARALAAEPGILVLDEAVAALDVSIQAQILNLLTDLRDEAGLTYVVITHDLAVARQLTNETVVMERGRVVERGATATILDSPSEPYTRMLRDSVPGPGWVPSRRSGSRSPLRAEC